VNSEEFRFEVNSLSIGKKLPTAQYLHFSILEDGPESLAKFVLNISRALKIEDCWNLVKLHRNEFKISFLNYPDFETSAYPALDKSYTVDLEKKKLEQKSYSAALNRPILHRKETLVKETHPLFEEFCLITKEGEQAGMYDNTSIIGYSQAWQTLMQQRGYMLVDGRLFRESGFDADKIDRQKTAISRYYLSTPFQLLKKANLISNDYTYLDYGCGRGDDLNILYAEGYDIIGWDPYHRPDGDLETRDIVNLGFVINVIEDRNERADALQRAFKLARKLLVISAMIATEKHISKFERYRDGVITSHNTFQKYFTQDELREYIEETICHKPISLGQGVFAIFRDDDLANSYLESKYKRKHSWNRARGIRLTKEKKIQNKIEANLPLLEAYWQESLLLGRFPQQSEFSKSEEIQHLFPSTRQLNSNLLSYFGEEQFLKAEREVREDLVLIQAMSVFTGKRIYNRLNDETQSEIRYFFTNFKSLQACGKELLESLSSTELIEASAESFFEECQTGFLESGHSLTIHKRSFDRLPVALRAYIGCALQLYSELEEIELIKLHFNSGKVSFMGYHGFGTTPLPVLRERIKVNLWHLRVDYFDYVDEFKPKPLYWKSKFIDAGDQDYNKQKAFDEKLALYGLAPKNPNFGPDRKELDMSLASAGFQIRGYRFYSKQL
jgi:DNA phosphorothioation-associated putative methyltransferase